MNWPGRIGAAVVLVILVSSCDGGNDEDRLLILPGEEITESELRDRWRMQLAEAPAAGASICAAIDGADPDEVLQYFEVSLSSDALAPSQLEDQRRAAEIFMEECSKRPLAT